MARRGFANSKTPVDDRDNWRTPPFVFGWAHRRYNFVADGAASFENALRPIWFDKKRSALDLKWGDWIKSGGAVWINPPYSDIDPWLEKARDEAFEGFTSVFLIPSPNGEERWASLVYNDASMLIDIVGRLSFLRADGTPMNGNNRGSCFVVYSPWRMGHIERNWVHRDLMKMT